MKVGKNVTIYAGGDRGVQDRLAAEKQIREAAGTQDGRGKKTGSFYAGNSALAQDTVEEKRQQARQKAMKLVSETFHNDSKIDEEIQSHRDSIAERKQEMKFHRDTVKTIKEQEKQMQAAYGVEDGSEEQQDAELLIRQQEGHNLTEEERNRVEQLKEEGLTEYQTNLLALNEDAVYHQRQADALQGQISGESGAVRSIKQERLKHDPMVKTQKQAEQIMDAAGEEIVGMLMDESKEHVDEEQEERKEQAEEIKEKREEQEELQEKRKEKQEELEELTEEIISGDISGTGKTKDELQQELENMMHEMKLLTEDLKGAAVDETV